MKKLMENWYPYIVIVVVVVLVRTFIVTPGIVSGSSMDDTLHDNDWVIINKIGIWSGIERFDIVVVDHGEGTIIKRVIGLPYETVKYRDNVLYIDDEVVKTPIEFESTDDFTLTAGKDEYIVLGDNREISKDSRVLGPINVDDIKGKVNLVIFPFRDFGYVK